MVARQTYRVSSQLQALFSLLELPRQGVRSHTKAAKTRRDHPPGQHRKLAWRLATCLNLFPAFCPAQEGVEAVIEAVNMELRHKPELLAAG